VDSGSRGRHVSSALAWVLDDKSPYHLLWVSVPS
jgi:hypothetical protein